MVGYLIKSKNGSLSYSGITLNKGVAFWCGLIVDSTKKDMVDDPARRLTEAVSRANW